MSASPKYEMGIIIASAHNVVLLNPNQEWECSMCNGIVTATRLTDKSTVLLSLPDFIEIFTLKEG